MGTTVYIVLGFSLVSAFFPAICETKKDGRECEVCVETIDTFRQQLPDELHNDTRKLEADFRNFCRRLPTGGKQNRFCYYVGGTDDAATGILNHVLEPIGYGATSRRICEQLNAMDSQICELRFDVKPDFTKLNKMRVGELQKILSIWGESMACAGCIEKAEYVKAVRDRLPKYEPEEWQKIQASENAEL